MKQILISTCLAAVFAWLISSAAKAESPRVDFADGGFVNGGFEDGTFEGWIVNDNPNPFFAATVVPLGVANSFGWSWNSTPTEGDFAAYHGFDGGVGEIRLSQDVVVSGTAIEFDFRHAWDLEGFGALVDRTFSVNVEEFGGGNVLQSDLILTALAGTLADDTGPRSGVVDIGDFVGDSVRISFVWTQPETFSGPAAAQLDNVRITGVPEPSATAVLIMGLLAVIARRRRVQLA